MRHYNIEDSIDLNKMPRLCEDCKAYLELSPDKEFIYHTPPSSPRGENLYIPDTPDEVYSSYKNCQPVICRALKLQTEVLGRIDPQLHGLMKSLFPIYLGQPPPIKRKGVSSSSTSEKIKLGAEVTSSPLDATAAAVTADLSAGESAPAEISSTEAGPTELAARSGAPAVLSARAGAIPKSQTVSNKISTHSQSSVSHPTAVGSVSEVSASTSANAACSRCIFF